MIIFILRDRKVLNNLSGDENLMMVPAASIFMDLKRQKKCYWVKKIIVIQWRWKEHKY